MRRWISFFGCLMLACVLAWMPAVTVSAEVGGNDASYTYTITLYAGNQGSFTNSSAVQVDNRASGSSYVISDVEKGGARIRITGLAYGDIVSVNVQSCVDVTESSRYYVKGLRESGRDNNTAGYAAFCVESDQDYVVAYGIKGDMVAYTVQYQDENGNALLESSSYYGTVGDQPVIAFLYIENYQPQAYNLTKTLSSNEADNVFTFVYTQIDQGSSSTDTDSTSDADGTNGTSSATNSDNGNGAASDSDNAADDEDDETDSEDAEYTPEELINLDDEDTPLSDMSNISSDSDERPAGMMPVFIAIAVIALAALLVLLVLVLGNKTRKAVNADEAQSGKKEK